MRRGAGDWDPGSYARFRDFRLRPALDLWRAAPPPPRDGDLIDLGCGDGAAGRFLAQAGGRLIGVDASPAMLGRARENAPYDVLHQADIRDWHPETPPALIFSNAVLHWLPDHEALLPRLARALMPGGVLAVQLPHQTNAPSHRVWRSLIEEHFPGRIDGLALPAILLAAQYHHILSPLGRFDLWETEYYQALPAAGTGHPVRHFTEATYARPLLALLDADERAHLVAQYETVMEHAYPRGTDGTVLFPFRRLFFTLRR